MKCETKNCDQPAEVEWTLPEVPGQQSRVARLCGACMARHWDEMTKRFPTSLVTQASAFASVVANG